MIFASAGHSVSFGSWMCAMPCSCPCTLPFTASAWPTGRGCFFFVKNACVFIVTVLRAGEVDTTRHAPSVGLDPR